MSYRTLLVNLDIDGPTGPIIRLSADLASRHGATVIGCCAADAPLPVMGPEGGGVAAELWQQAREEIEKRLGVLHAEFDRLAAEAGIAQAQWRQAVDNPARRVARYATAADLVVTAAPRGAAVGDRFRATDTGSLVLQSGRPTLVVAEGAEHLLAKTVVIAWKETREARRAVADAVPLLEAANEVIVVAVDANPDGWVRAGADDVVSFLGRHGIAARCEIIKARDEAGTLTEFVASCRSDLVVSGAYGHSRLREWAFGGVTRSLLDEVGVNRFMSN